MVKDTGEPDKVGEVLHQAGATATAVVAVLDPPATTSLTQPPKGELVWEVRRHRDNRVTHTRKLAHAGHWESEHRWGLPS